MISHPVIGCGDGIVKVITAPVCIPAQAAQAVGETVGKGADAIVNTGQGAVDVVSKGVDAVSWATGNHGQIVGFVVLGAALFALLRVLGFFGRAATTVVHSAGEAANIPTSARALGLHAGAKVNAKRARVSHPIAGPARRPSGAYVHDHDAKPSPMIVAREGHVVSVCATHGGMAHRLASSALQGRKVVADGSAYPCDQGAAGHRVYSFRVSAGTSSAPKRKPSAPKKKR